MMMGLLSDDGAFALDYRSHVGALDLSTVGRLPGHHDDELRVPRPERERPLVQYFAFMAFDERFSDTDKRRRAYKAIIESKRCPGCNWIPKWRSSYGPYPLLESDVVWCSKKCRERTEKA